MTAKKWINLFGVVFLLVGVAGLLGGLGIVGQSGIFMTDSMHDWIHLLTGVVFLLVSSKWPEKSSGALKLFGVIYLIVAILGFVGNGVVLGMMMNNADNWLHLVLALVILCAGFSKRS